MAESSNSASQSPSLGPASKSQSSGGRQRIISSCLTCRRRKVRCDHVHPICGACTRGNHVCTYATEQSLAQLSSLAGNSKISKTSPPAAKGARGPDVQARLDRLELLLEKAVSTQGPTAHSSDRRTTEHDRREPESMETPSTNSQGSQGAGISSDNHDGTLLLEDGQTQFVSSLHWALLADEIQDIKALIGDRSENEFVDRENSNPDSLVSLLSLGRAPIGLTLQSLLPKTQEHQDALLELFFTNVDPMIRIVHKPTLRRKFPTYIRDTSSIAFAVFYGTINALSPSDVEERFGETKDVLLRRYEQGVEISLARENYLTTSSLEVLQGFILWLTCITKEDDMGKAWALLGIANRIALNQGLHRDPSLFPSGSMDAITIEVRRRLWHQICHLEYRAAECKGQEPNISDDDFTTLLPRNIDDEELVEGASPGPSSYDEPRFTDMTFQIIRFVGMSTLRRIVQSTYKLERRMLESGLQGTSCPDAVQELTKIYNQIKTMVDGMHEGNHRKYLRYCNPEISGQRLCLGLASMMEWRCYLLFWLRMPRAYREMVFTDDVRKSIFEKSVNLIETLNGAVIDVDVARFQWHIGGHASFQSIMHTLSELRNPIFNAQDRQRALRALQMAKMLKENNTAKAWLVVKGMIEKAIVEHSVNQPYMNATTLPGDHSSNYGPQNSLADFSRPIYIDQIPHFAIQNQDVAPPADAYHEEAQQEEFDWDGLNINDIMGDIQPTPGLQNQQFNWVGLSGHLFASRRRSANVD
ncbi:fungal-specific transcription factor domain-domain-containing protein [Clohesyomyces aquaticus]|uniref:Fungal-specific transcription factor domain-domain-containing protein n=1 Tax=Clohesyomyces aquaticus TaxID=1231657 RepID=A0A1Y1YR53_9PLEO|nr:fungal-specific transcription factor domain-domain-containing protein [Clohesyomyces aquaticus]